MVYRKLQGTGLDASAMALGTVAYGTALEERECHRQMETFLENGGNLIDTAHVYNDWEPGERHRSEAIIGRYLRASGNRRLVILATKGAHPALGDMARSRVTRGELERDLAESLDCLGTDCVDLYFLHRDNPAVPVDEICDWMNELVGTGCIRYWGCSNWAAERIRQAVDYEKNRRRTGFVCNQAMHSYASVRRAGLTDQTMVPMDEGMLRLHGETGLNLMAYTAQAKGYFSRLASGESVSSELAALYGTPENERKLEKLKRMSRDTGLAVAQLTLLYFTTLPFAAIPIATFNTWSYFEEALAAFSEENLQAVNTLDFAGD